MQKESFKVCLAYSAIKFIVKTQFKDAKEVTQQKVTLFIQALFTKVKHTSRYGVTVHLRYDVTGQELTDWPEIDLVGSYKYQLETLAKLYESNLTVLSRRRCLTLSGYSITLVFSEQHAESPITFILA